MTVWVDSSERVGPSKWSWVRVSCPGRRVGARESPVDWGVGGRGARHRTLGGGQGGVPETLTTEMLVFKGDRRSTREHLGWVTREKSFRGPLAGRVHGGW